MDQQKVRRILLPLVGVALTGICVGVFKFAAFGVDPYQSFMSGMDALVPIPFGTLYMIVNAVMLLFALVFDRHYIGIGTFLNLFLLGYIVEFSQRVLESLFPEASVLLRILIFVPGFIFLCLGCSMYITADLGVSTYDAIALVCSEKWKLGKFKYIRICTDLVCVLLGIGLFLTSGGAVREIPTFVGFGTLATAFALGPLIDWFNRKVSGPLLRGKRASRGV